MDRINSFTCHSLESHSEEKKCPNLVDKEQHLILPSTVESRAKIAVPGTSAIVGKNHKAF